jgi:molybdopterin biosynthesis enzyme
MMTKVEALRAIAVHAAARRATASVPLALCGQGEASRRISARPSTSRRSDKATMDGWAVRASDVASPATLVVAGRITAGATGAPSSPEPRRRS